MSFHKDDLYQTHDDFRAWLYVNMPTVLHNLDISTYEPRWRQAKEEYDKLFRVWRGAQDKYRDWGKK